MTHIQQRRDLKAEWESVNPTLWEGEVGWETDTGRGKIGDGVTDWMALPYLNNVSSVAGKTGHVTLEVTDVAGAAGLESPHFTGHPTAPTKPSATSDTSLATTEFVQDQKDSPQFTGSPTAPTQENGADDDRIATTAFVQAAILEAMSEALLAYHPINSLYFSEENVDPGTLFGGSWVRYGKGRTIVGVDEADTNFNTVAKTGGAPTHTLSLGEMPRHSHGGATEGQSQSHTHREHTVSNTVVGVQPGASGVLVVAADILDTTGIESNDHYHLIPNQGGGAPHNNLQPYITTYIWKRVS